MSKEAVRYLYVAFTQSARLDVAIVSRSTWRIIPSAINRIRSLAWSMSIDGQKGLVPINLSYMLALGRGREDV